MIALRPGDLVTVSHNGKLYAALILERMGLFGGSFAFVFHRTSDEPLTASEWLALPQSGFHAYVDFIHARRENRLTRVASKVDTQPFAGPGYLKLTWALKGRAPFWVIYSMDQQELRRVEELSPEERRYPL